VSPDLSRFLQACIAFRLEVTEDENEHTIRGHSCEFSVYKIREPLLNLVEVRPTFRGITEASFIISLSQHLGLGLGVEE
jgi:hypothetical protein